MLLGVMRMVTVRDRQGEGQGTKCHAGNETEAGEDGRC